MTSTTGMHTIAGTLTAPRVTGGRKSPNPGSTGVSSGGVAISDDVRPLSISNTFTPGQINIRPRRMIKVFDAIRSLNGAALAQSHYTATAISIAAANLNRTQNVFDLDGNVTPLFTSTETVPVWASHILACTLIGNKPFAMYPFLLCGENGESISSSDSASTSPITATRAAISGGNYILGFGNIFEASRRYEGSVIYRVDLTIDLAPWMNRYADYYWKKLLAEEQATAKILRLGFTTFGQASTTITYDSASYMATFQVNPDGLRAIPMS